MTAKWVAYIRKLSLQGGKSRTASPRLVMWAVRWAAMAAKELRLKGLQLKALPLTFIH